MFNGGELSPARRPSSCPLAVLVVLQWVAIAGVCAFVYFYVNLQKEHIDKQVAVQIKNITAPCCQFGLTELRNQVAESDKPVAHFTGLAVTGGQNISRRLLFETTRGHAFNTLGMKYDQNGYLVVPRKGLYFIYAQVTFYCSSHCTKPPHQFSACIHKRTRHYPEPEVLLKSHVRPPTDTDGYLRFSTYQAGVFELFNNDSLYIEVYKDPAFRVSVHEHETYFGAFLL